MLTGFSSFYSFKNKGMRFGVLEELVMQRVLFKLMDGNETVSIDPLFSFSTIRILLAQNSFCYHCWTQYFAQCIIVAKEPIAA